MKPYYDHAGIQIFHGDCLEIMPQLEPVDLVLTDPPYGINYGRAGGFCVSHGWGPWRENVEWDIERPGREPFDIILKHSVVQIIWGGNYFTDYLPPSMRWLIWDKGQRNFSLADFEIAWTSQHKASRIFNYARSKANRDGKQFATQKPIALMKWCIGLSGSKGTILDPFMGSGTTLIAAKELNQKAIGIEIEEKTCEIAARRLSQEVFDFTS